MEKLIIITNTCIDVYTYPEVKKENDVWKILVNDKYEVIKDEYFEATNLDDHRIEYLLVELRNKYLSTNNISGNCEELFEQYENNSSLKVKYKIIV